MRNYSFGAKRNVSIKMFKKSVGLWLSKFVCVDKETLLLFFDLQAKGVNVSTHVGEKS